MKIQHASVIHKQVPITQQVKTAFGTMKTRNAVFLVVEDETGRHGIGDSWVNFPLWAPASRVALFEQAVIPAIIGKEVEDIPRFISALYRGFFGQAEQSGTAASLLQGVCAVELALYDLAAQREDAPLASHLFPSPQNRVRVYASGINSPLPFDLIDEHLDRGVTLFKLKLGFSEYEDRANLDTLCSYLQGRAEVAVDINRGWDMETALQWLPVLEAHNIRWIEEPLRVRDEPNLSVLRRESRIPIARGENTMMPPDCSLNYIANTETDILQPDITKYAPLHIACRLIGRMREKDIPIIPHFLGPATGQAATLHFAAGCNDGLCEWDINRNPLRTDLFTPAFDIRDGYIELPDTAGIGWRMR